MSSRHTKQLRILYVEDDMFAAGPMQQNIEDRGCAVTHTQSAREAIELLRKTKRLNAAPFDGVVTDWEILEGHGLMVAEEAIALGVPVRVMSGRSAPTDQWAQLWIDKGFISDLYRFLDSLKRS